MPYTIQTSTEKSITRNNDTRSDFIVATKGFLERRRETDEAFGCTREGKRGGHVARKDTHPLAYCFAYGSAICSSTFARREVESDRLVQ
jgi:hypothetical protein